MRKSLSIIILLAAIFLAIIAFFILNNNSGFKFDEEQNDNSEMPCKTTYECTDLAIELNNPEICNYAKDSVYEGGEDVGATEGRRYCLLRLVWENKDIEVCNQYLPGDSVCEYRANRP